MANEFRFKFGGLAQILKSAEVAAATKSAAEDIAARASGRTDDPIVVAQSAPIRRARAAVLRLGSGAQGEAKDRALGGSV